MHICVRGRWSSGLRSGLRCISVVDVDHQIYLVLQQWVLVCCLRKMVCSVQRRTQVRLFLEIVSGYCRTLVNCIVRLSFQERNRYTIGTSPSIAGLSVLIGKLMLMRSCMLVITFYQSDLARVYVPPTCTTLLPASPRFLRPVPESTFIFIYALAALRTTATP